MKPGKLWVYDFDLHLQMESPNNLLMSVNLKINNCKKRGKLPFSIMFRIVLIRPSLHKFNVFIVDFFFFIMSFMTILIYLSVHTRIKEFPTSREKYSTYRN